LLIVIKIITKLDFGCSIPTKIKVMIKFSDQLNQDN